MLDDPKSIVSEAYNDIAPWYLEWVSKQPSSPRERYTNIMLKNLPTTAPQKPRILEVGCGPGIPTTRMLLDRGAHVVANDIAAKQLEMARVRCPEASFIEEDMALLDFRPGGFDGVIHAWLKPGGVFVFNLATVDMEEIHGEFLGRGMFWSSYGVNQSMAMVRGAGFEVLESETLEAGDGELGESDPDYGVKFRWVAARKWRE
ncbi:methyltransferase type 11 [Chaetomium sp. MPI-SDFR-AT-0129]|nr:methyltransferase type 11 [Chaetomium sp. MPI-SDFR-AT-0129]